MELALILFWLPRWSWRPRSWRFALRRPCTAGTAAPDPRLDTLIAAQGEIAGQFSQTLEAQAELQKQLTERIDALKAAGRLAERQRDQDRGDHRSIGERLTVIDEAQKNISALSGQVVGLQEILSDKQAARRLRAGAHGSDRRRPARAVALRIPVHAVQRHRGPTASSVCPM